MTLLKISHESSLLALQVGAPLVMSCDITTEIWLLKGDLLSKLLGMYLCHSFELRNEIWFEYCSLYDACFGLYRNS